MLKRETKNVGMTGNVERHEIQNSPYPYLDRIKDGEKKYEGRLGNKVEPKSKENPKGWDLFIGKEMIFFDKENPDSWVWIKVTSLPRYANFGEAFDDLGSKLIPGKTREEVVELYNGLFDLSEIAKNGVVAIGFDVLGYVQAV